MGEELELETRRKIYSFIQEHPGTHEREISRRLHIPLSTLDYHLHLLSRRDLISSSEDGHYKKYYATGKISVKEKKIIGILRQKVKRKIIIFLLLNPDSTHKKICEYINLAPSTTSFHLNILVDLEIIKRNLIGRETEYYVENPEYISDLVLTYKKSFVDDMVERFADAWLDLHPKNIRKQKKEKK